MLNFLSGDGAARNQAERSKARTREPLFR